MMEWLQQYPALFAIVMGAWTMMLVDLQNLYNYKKLEDAQAGFQLKVAAYQWFRGALGGFIAYVTGTGLTSAFSAVKDVVN